MFRLPKELRTKEILIQRVILFAVGLLLVVVYFDKILYGIGRILGICFPFILGAFLAFVFNVIANSLLRFGKKWFKIQTNRGTRLLANICAIFVFVLLLVVFVFVLFPRILESLQSVMADLPASLNAFYLYLLDLSKPWPPIHDWIGDLDFSVYALSQMMENVFSWTVQSQTGALVDSLYNFLSSAFSVVFNSLLTIMFSLIVLFNKKTMVREARALVKAYIPERYADYFLHVAELVNSTFTAYIGGSCLECLILGTLVAVGCTIFRLPYALLSGLVVGIGALVPMFGALVAAILVAFFIALEYPLQGLYFIILFICIQQVEGNFIYPNVVGKSVGLPAFYVAVAVTVGANVAGIPGMILFIPVVSCIYQVIKENVQHRLRARE